MRIFLCIDPGMLARVVAGHYIPESADNESYQRADPKRCPPSMVKNYIGDHGWRDSCARAYARENQSVRKAPLLRWNPCSHKAVAGRIHYGLTHAQRKPHHHQDD